MNIGNESYSFNTRYYTRSSRIILMIKAFKKDTIDKWNIKSEKWKTEQKTDGFLSHPPP